MPHPEDRQTDSVASTEGGGPGSDKKDGSGSHRLEHRVVVPAISLEVPD